MSGVTIRPLDANSPLQVGRVDPRYDPIFEERPLTARHFLVHPDYGNQGMTIWPGVLEELDAIFGHDPTRFQHREVFLQWAIGAGKSTLVSAAMCYLLYWTLNLRDPQGYFGLSPHTPIMWINQSINAPQAKRVVFQAIANAVEQSPWFRTHGYPPDPNVRSELRFPKDILVFPGSSSTTTPAGYALMGGVIDEAALFETVSEEGAEFREDAVEEIYVSMRQRIYSRFGFRGMLMMVSSPRHTDDFIEKMVQFALFGDPDRGIKAPEWMYASRKALWETKPGRDLDESGLWLPWDLVEWRQERTNAEGQREVAFRLDIPRSLVDDFQANPERSKRVYAGLASRVGIGYFWDPDVVKRPRAVAGMPGYNPDRHHPCAYENGVLQIGPDLAWRRSAASDSTIHHAHVDLGLVHDAVGLALGHVEGATIVRGTRRPLIVMDLMLEMRPPDGSEIELAQIRELLLTLRARGFPLQYVTLDQFASADIVQQLNKSGMEAEVLSIDRDTIAYESLKECINEGRLDYYYYEPFYDCIRSLIVTRTGRIDHAPGKGKKDVSDAVAGVCRTLTERWAIYNEPAVARGASTVVVASRGIGGRREGPY